MKYFKLRSMLITLSILLTLNAAAHEETNVQILEDSEVGTFTLRDYRNSNKAKTQIAQPFVEFSGQTRALTAVTPEQVAGIYLECSYNNTVNHYDTQDSVVVAFPTNDSITIYNLQGSKLTVGGRVDWTNRIVTFQPQPFGTITVNESDENGNNLPTTYPLTFAGDTVPAPVYGTISEAGELLLGRWYGLTGFDDGMGGTTYDWPTYLGMQHTQFLVPNANMKTVDYKGREHNYNLYVSYISDDQLAFVNFGGCALITADLLPGGTMTIEAGQVFYFYNFFYGYASMYSANISEDGTFESVNNFRNIKVTGDNKSCEIAPWAVCFYSATSAPREEWITKSTTITLHDGYEFTYPQASSYGWAGEGTKENPFKLATAKDFEMLNNHVISGEYFEGIHFEMVSDIDFTASSFQGVGTMYVVESTFHFDGILDGKGHKISNLRVKGIKYNESTGLPNLSNEISNPSCLYVGLFGELRGTICNLTIDETCSFEGASRVGAFAGATKTTLDAKIINCRNFANVTGLESYVGGIVGYTGKDNYIANCYNEGTILCSGSSVGGIAGYLFRSTAIGCQNAGHVMAIDTLVDYGVQRHVGGIAGYNCGTTIKHCINSGVIEGLESVGGIAGETFNAIFTTTIDSCLNVGTLICPDPGETGAIYGHITSGDQKAVNTLYDNQMTFSSAVMGEEFNGVTGMTTAQLIQTGHKQLIDTWWTQTAGAYPALKAFADLNQDWRKNYILFAEGQSAGDFTVAEIPAGVTATLVIDTAFRIENNKLYAPERVLVTTRDTLILQYGKNQTIVPIRVMPGLKMPGSGTEADPFTIASTDEFIAFAEYVNAYNETFEGMHIRVTKPLNFKDKTYVIPYSTGNAQFEGTFDGNKMVFSNIHIDLGTTSTAASNYKGLFGTVGPKGTLKNIGLRYSSFFGYGHCGLLVGILYGTLENCTTDANSNIAIANYNVGGLVGNMRDSALILNCTNNASVYAIQNVGGIAGLADSPNVRIIGTKNYADISNFNDQYGGVSCATGFVPRFSGTMVNCENHGDIESYQDNAAGFVYYATTTAKFIDCINYGDVTSHATQFVAGHSAGICNMTSEKGGIVFERCGNVGTIHSKLNYAAGICGLPNASFTDCWNMGEIITDNVFGGGIVAYTTNHTTSFLRCWNTGNVHVGDAYDNGWNAGGIIGYTVDFKATISECWNAGKVTSFKSTIDKEHEEYEYQYTIAGGIVGSGNAQVSDCFNVGTIVSNKEVGGIFGSPWESAAAWRCWNAGVVSSTYDADFGSNIVGGSHTYGSTFENMLFDQNSALQSFTLDGWYVASNRANLTSEAVSTQLGDKFDYSDVATYPRLKSFAINDTVSNISISLGQKSAAVACATFILGEADAYQTAATATVPEDGISEYIPSVTQPIQLGLFDEVTWEATGGLTISADGYAFPTALGEAELTVSMDGTNYTKTFKFNVTGTTAIENIESDSDFNQQAPVYDLYGRRIEKMQPGRLYIQSGRKLMYR